MNILKLKDIMKSIDDSYVPGASSGVVTCSMVDMLFHQISKRGIKEVSVDFDEMFTIVRYTIANARGGDDDWNNLKVIQEGKIDKFFGVKLHLEDYERQNNKIIETKS